MASLCAALAAAEANFSCLVCLEPLVYAGVTATRLSERVILFPVQATDSGKLDFVDQERSR